MWIVDALCDSVCYRCFLQKAKRKAKQMGILYAYNARLDEMIFNIDMAGSQKEIVGALSTGAVSVS